MGAVGSDCGGGGMVALGRSLLTSSLLHCHPTPSVGCVVVPNL